MRATHAGRALEAAAVDARRRVMLDDEVLEVGEPDRPVGTDRRVDRRHPLVGGCHQVEGVLGDVARALRLDVHERDQLHGRLADHGLALVAGREGGRIDEVGTRGGGVATHHVDLPEVRGDGMRLLDRVDLLGRHRARTLRHEVLGDAAEEDRGAVGGAAELVAHVVVGLGPGVVGELVQELQGLAVGGEPEGAHREVELLPADLAGEAAVADGAAEPIVVAVGKVAGLGVRVADAPTRHDDLADVGLVVAVGVLEEDERRRLAYDDAAVGEDDAGRDVEAVGEDGELVGLAVAVGVLADLDAVLPLLVVDHAVRVVRGLEDPEATARIPGERDRLHDVGLGGEEHELEVGRHLGALHAALDGERLLERQGLRALLVVGDPRALLAHFRLALLGVLAPVGDAGGVQAGGQFLGEGGGVHRLLGDEDLDGGARGQLHRGVERRRTIGARADEQRVVTLERRGRGRLAAGVVEPDRVATERGHERVQVALGRLLGAGGVEVEDADGTGGGGSGRGEEREADGSEQGAHGRGDTGKQPFVPPRATRSRSPRGDCTRRSPLCRKNTEERRPSGTKKRRPEGRRRSGGTRVPGLSGRGGRRRPPAWTLPAGR